MRLGFAIAAFLDADNLLLDEVFAVGDEAFQRKCFGRIFEFKQRGGTIVFVSHDAVAVERLCERAVLLTRRGGVRRSHSRGDRALPADARGEHDPAERGAGLREWGTGEAVITRPGCSARKERIGSSFSPESPCRSRSRSRRVSLSRRRSYSSSSGTTRVSYRIGCRRDAGARWNGAGRLEAT